MHRDHLVRMHMTQGWEAHAAKRTAHMDTHQSGLWTGIQADVNGKVARLQAAMTASTDGPAKG